MSKHPESAADRVWKEKVEFCVSLKEAIVMLALAVALAGALFAAS